jgi:hypothetical protein
MGQRLDIRQGTWQRRSSDRRWLALLVDAMEEAARPEIRSQPVEGEVLAALRAQLARPAARYAYVPSAVRH